MSNDTRNLALVIIAAILSIGASVWLWGQVGGNQRFVSADPSLSSPSSAAGAKSTTTTSATSIASDGGSPAPSGAAEERANGGAKPIPLRITAKWLVGTWGPIETTTKANDWLGCQESGLVSFAADGTYQEEEAYGRFKTDGRTIAYYETSNNEDDEDGDAAAARTRQAAPPQITTVRAIDQNTMQEGKSIYVRCPD